MKLVDELGGGGGTVGFGWLVEGELMQRASHALLHDGRVWLVDPVDAPHLEDRIRALGQPGGVLQLLDRHGRDCARWAERLGVPHVPAYTATAETPFTVIPVLRRRRWREVALWWPEQHVLVAGDVLGTAPYFLAPRDRLGVHPLLRLTPPRGLAGLKPERILVGHGAGVHDGATDALRQALSTARRRAPGLVLGLARGLRARG